MNVIWYFNRLRAMSIREIFWRLDQKKLAKAERQTFGKEHTKITERVFYQGKEDLIFHVENLPIAEYGQKAVYNSSIPLLGGYDYAKYRKNWHGGFQTENKWSLNFSYDLQYKQRDEIGDVRTNWELNRHFQFALLACNYYHTGEIGYLSELSELFMDWNKENPFLYGISWTSVMEVAIRDINWIYALGFLTKVSEPDAMVAELCEQLRIGIINMTAYISAHYSRYSSANNHVIVEASAMGIAGIVMECEEWVETALSILNHEISRQNYKDGVNKEVSLHYQSFFMEAVGQFMLVMQHDGRNIPMIWCYVLQKMSRYVADCQGNYGETIVFGDDDAGKILDLEGVAEGERKTYRNHYHYVLQLMSILLPERYVDEVTDVSLLQLVSENEVKNAMKKFRYVSKRNVCYEEGGVTLVKSRDDRVFIGIDHGELGFGSIAAHGHADALSFQMYLDGKSVFADAGTYIYHTDLESRNAFRKTENHNTVIINGKDQSEMLGAFLWGKRAKTTLLSHNLSTGNAWREEEKEDRYHIRDNGNDEEILYLEAEHDGYTPVIHRRKFVFCGNNLKIYDSLLHVKKELSYGIHFMLGKNIKVRKGKADMKDSLCIETVNGKKMLMQVSFLDGTMQLNAMKQRGLPTAEISSTWISEEYGLKRQTEQIRFSGKTKCDITIVTTITWENNG